MPSTFDASFSISTVFIGSGRLRQPAVSLMPVTRAEEKAESFLENTKKV